MVTTKSLSSLYLN